MSHSECVMFISMDTMENIGIALQLTFSLFCLKGEKLTKGQDNLPKLADESIVSRSLDPYIIAYKTIQISKKESLSIEIV